ncbi:long-chain-fatty-acid--CoA ligase [Streptomyces sp. NPDC017979]|uniref:long-chain-fatty-acid--CoA ligase n=1 Tax=Streptomyces sp. NPDC017979 TaxID=3365024 RepID=UPI00378F3ED7
MYLTQPLHRALQHAPDAPMTVCGERTKSTRQVVDRVARLASALQELGVAAKDRVGILTLNSDRVHESFLAIWWIGAAAHPLNARWSSAEIAYALNDSGAEVLLVDDDFAGLVPELRARCVELRTVVHCGDGPAPDGMLRYEDLIRSSTPVPDGRHGGDALALILYTGGTTGLPKGVMISHRSLCSSLFGSMLAMRNVDRGGVTLVTVPLFHIAAVCSWYAQLLMGGTLVFLPLFRPADFLQAVERHRVTTCILIPTMVQMLCEHPELGDHDVSSLRSITYGGAASSDTLLHRAMETFPGAGFSQGYGMTETGVLCTLGREEHVRGGARQRSTGRATPTVEIAVLGPDGSRLPPGRVGEIATRGDHVMLGYWGKPDETARALRDGWMHTGDAGRLDDDGYLYVVDRLKDMIITGGENVYSAEVENALAAHPAVASCAVIGVPDDRWGERVHAVVVLRPGRTATAEEIRTHAKSLIAGYKAPRTVEFAETLPTSAAGKILKRVLRDAPRPAAT